MTEPGGSANQEDDGGESKSKKRRMSLRLESQSHSPEHRIRNLPQVADSNDQAKGRTVLMTKVRHDRDPEVTNRLDTSQHPSNGATSKFDHKRSTRSPSAHTSDSEHKVASTTKSPSRNQQPNTPMHSSKPARYSTSGPHVPMVPKWRTLSVEDDQAAPTRIPTPKGSTQTTYLPTSVASPHMRSPPPSFNLSSGRPLVNPPLKTQAAFVGKLYAMLEDEDIKKTGLIYWSPDGAIFTCPNPTEFSKIVLPRFFKHNNWQSFVRQLNMYSFSKVNDLFATTTDPGAWEFRHPLFRRGEPQMLASIKRKTTRNPVQDGSASLASPVEEYDQSKAMAGWMRDVPSPTTYRVESPPRDREMPVLPPVRRAAGHEGPSIPSSSQGDSPPASRGYAMPSALPRIHAPGDTLSQPRHHLDDVRSSMSARFTSPGYSESLYYPHPQQSPVDILSGQIVALEERVQRLSDLLAAERIANVRSSLDSASYLLQLTGWIGEGKAPPQPDLRALQDTLSRASHDMRQRYEALMASDALAVVAGRGERGHGNGYGTGPPLQQPHAQLPRSQHPTLPDLRLAMGNPPRRGSPNNIQLRDSHTRQMPPLADDKLHAVPYDSQPLANFFRPYSTEGDKRQRDNPDQIRLSLPPLDRGRSRGPSIVVKHGEGHVTDGDESMQETRPSTKGLSSLLN